RCLFVASACGVPQTAPQSAPARTPAPAPAPTPEPAAPPRSAPAPAPEHVSPEDDMPADDDPDLVDSALSGHDLIMRELGATVVDEYPNV
ncbi:DNA polymerase III subunit gamma and tau, partial [Streptomyces alfalfae]